MTQKIRGFELVKGETNLDLLPKRSTQHSAGYDFVAAETITIDPGAIKLVPTNVKAYMQEGEVLYLYDRSSNPRKRGIVLSNSVGVIDRDYYGNSDNDGNIHAQFTNITNDVVTIEKGTAMMQGVFMPFLLVDDDDASGVRVGGFGSTDQ